jgi:hypothetical protein
MTSIEKTKDEMKKYEQIRDDFYSFLDANIKKSTNDQFDFSNPQTLDAKEAYEHFFKLDYQARKIRGLLFEARDMK